MSQNQEVPKELKETGNYIEIRSDRCKGCYLCIDACPHNLIEKSDTLNSAGCYPVQPSEVAHYKCTACGLCFQMCPDAGIAVYKKEKEADA